MYHGWKVAAAAFLVALFGWGLGFYGVAVFVATLREAHGWSAAAISGAVTAYYLTGGILIAFISRAFDRWGPRRVVLVGMAAMGSGALLLTRIAAPWQLYPAFLLMAVGWACMSGAALNLIIAPWFERARGRAVSLAFNGASFGGILVAPALLFLIAHLGYGPGVLTVCVAMAAVLLPLVGWVMHAGPGLLGLGPDGDPIVAATPPVPGAGGHVSQRNFLRSRHFWTISAPFALALMAQVGFITHQVSYLKPLIGTAGAGWAVSITTLGAVAGRLLVGTFVDRVSRRRVAAGNFVIQAAGLALLLFIGSPVALYAGCALFGLGVGNTTSLPSLIIQVEFPKAAFGRIVGAVISINQFTYSFGPSILGWLRDWQGRYDAALGVCVALYLLAGILVLRRAADAQP